MILLKGATNIISGNSGYGDDTPHLPIALGLRWSMRPEGGFSVAATGCTRGYNYLDETSSVSGSRSSSTGNRASATLTAGYRWGFDTLFFELALGGGIAKSVDRGFKNWDGAFRPPRNEVGFQPDGALALGARF